MVCGPQKSLVGPFDGAARRCPVSSITWSSATRHLVGRRARLRLCRCRRVRADRGRAVPWTVEQKLAMREEQDSSDPPATHANSSYIRRASEPGLVLSILETSFAAKRLASVRSRSLGRGLMGSDRDWLANLDVTCAGEFAAFDLAISSVEDRCGVDVARSVCRFLTADRWPEGEKLPISPPRASLWRRERKADPHHPHDEKFPRRAITARRWPVQRRLRWPLRARQKPLRGSSDRGARTGGMGIPIEHSSDRYRCLASTSQSTGTSLHVSASSPHPGRCSRQGRYQRT